MIVNLTLAVCGDIFGELLFLVLVLTWPESRAGSSLMSGGVCKVPLPSATGAAQAQLTSGPSSGAWIVSDHRRARSLSTSGRRRSQFAAFRRVAVRCEARGNWRRHSSILTYACGPFRPEARRIGQRAGAYRFRYFLKSPCIVQNRRTRMM